MYIPARIARVRVFRVLKEIFCMAVFSVAVIISGDDNTLIARIKRFFLREPQRYDFLFLFGKKVVHKSIAGEQISGSAVL